MSILSFISLVSAIGYGDRRISAIESSSSAVVKPLDVIEVTAPINVPAVANCTVQLMQYTFGWSYGKPFVGSYSPPQCDFNRVTITFQATSVGRQFDRLALMYLGDTEVWRTSTAEPNANGIIWTYTKDVSNFLPLWKQPQKVIFDLGNIVDSKYTGSYNTTLTATFFTSPTKNQPADLILPVSKKQSSNNQSSAFAIPQDGPARTVMTLPRNARRAIFTISACGQADEEFWWSNVPQSSTKTFAIAGTTMLGYSPFRELQLLVDGQLAGIAWPFPVIFTGGVVPTFWRPIVGIDTYDLKEDEIDITPWLPVLSDGKDHTFEIRVMGVNDTDAGNVVLSPPGSNWVVTGKVFVWLDRAGTITTGQPPKVQASEPKITIDQAIARSPQGFNVSLSYKVTASRDFSVDGSVTTSEGTKPASWKQTYNFSNIGSAANLGNNQTNVQVTNGLDISAGGYSRTIAYPLRVFSAANIDVTNNSMTLSGRFTRGKEVMVLGNSATPSALDNFGTGPDAKGTFMNTTQEGEAYYQTIGNTTKGSAVTEQVYIFSSEKGDTQNVVQPPKAGEREQLYSRHVLAKNGLITRDEVIQIVSSNSPEGLIGLTPIVPTPALPSAPTTTAFAPVRFESSQMVVIPLGKDDMESFFGRKYRFLADKASFPTTQRLVTAWKRAIGGDHVRRQI
ncbi:hypothetical protein BT63DRAFT_377319 [Microthyrium microscopicum]|uniref:Peptide N-acetyl-beta-D-glucosaminyl asparaginase amidase A N-terminal domain-containing protein n=1 Tax=Microthyrium microscopicum TaxID=703497 RepID=A0A6A6U1W0_9PEZI|nr:hypothetical protein BT63DRAFT_377319 [Microthyrium microscopicum]